MCVGLWTCVNPTKFGIAPITTSHISYIITQPNLAFPPLLPVITNTSTNLLFLAVLCCINGGGYRGFGWGSHPICCCLNFPQPLWQRAAQQSDCVPTVRECLLQLSLVVCCSHDRHRATGEGLSRSHRQMHKDFAMDTYSR